MPWGEEQDHELLASYRRLIAVRRGHPVIWRGVRITLHVEEATWAYALCGEGSPPIVALHAGHHPQDLVLDVAGLDLRDGEALRDLLGDGMAIVRGGRLRLSLPAWNGGKWKARSAKEASVVNWVHHSRVG